jgi:hypothetical protein
LYLPVAGQTRCGSDGAPLSLSSPARAMERFMFCALRLALLLFDFFLFGTVIFLLLLGRKLKAGYYPP